MCQASLRKDEYVAITCCTPLRLALSWAIVFALFTGGLFSASQTSGLAEGERVTLVANSIGSISAP